MNTTWRTLLALSVVGLTAGCGSDPTAPEAVAVDPSFSAVGPAVASVQGGGHFRPDGENLRTFAFTALTYADGSVRGSATLKNRAGTPAQYQMEVICARHIGAGRAAVAARVTHVVASSVVQVGSEVGFGAADNGKGADATPDQITTLADLSAPPVPLPPLPFAYGFRDLFCDTTPGRAPFYAAVLNGLFPLFGVDIEQGDIQVTAP